MKTLLFGNGSASLDDVYPSQNIDLAPEVAFDDLTCLAACICQTPIALLCLIDTRHQWLKSQVGLEQESIDAYLRLCIETMLQPESRDSGLLLVQDALLDPRFATYELVASSRKVRFYASIPLVTPEGLILGILSVIDRVPRSLTLQQQQALAALGRQAISLTAYCANAPLDLCKNLTSLKGIISKRQQVEEVRQESHQELADIKLVLDQSSLVAITDHKGTINYVNHKFCEISQYSREELLGQTHRRLNSAYHPSDFFKRMWTTIAEGKVWKGEIKNRAKDGSFYWMDTTIVPILNNQGKPYEYVSICKEITEHKQAQEEYERFFTLAPDLLCVVGLDGYFKRVNPAFETTLLYTPEELFSQPFLDFVHPDDQAATLAELEKLATHPATIHVENRYRCCDGFYKWLAWSCVPLVEEGLFYAIARDITQSKETEAALLEQSRLSTLEVEVGAVLGESDTLHSSLQHGIEVIVTHLGTMGAAIWTVDLAAVEASNLLPLNLQASAGQLTPANDNIISAIAQTRQPVSIELPTTSHPSQLQPFLTGYPLIAESRLVGVMALLTQQPLSEAVRETFGRLANAIAVAIDRTWVREELLRRREALLFQLANQIRNSLDLDTILGTAITEIRSLLGIDCCHFLWCWSQESNQSTLSVTHEAREADLPSLLGEGPPPHLAPMVETIRNLQMLRIDDVSLAPGLDPQTRSLLVNWGITSGLLLPLKTKTGQLGAIVCSNYDGPRLWSDREVELLQAVVDQLAIAIEHAELFATTRATALAAQTQARQLEQVLQDLKQTEARLIQTEKMSSIGQMVAGIAHEINNPVSFITGNLCHATHYIEDLLNLIESYQQHYPNPDPSIQEQIEEIDLEFLVEDLPKILSSMQMGADRIHEIVLSLRNFSRLDEAEMKPVNIHEGIDSTLLILHNRLKASGSNPGITIIKEYSNLPPVMCYAGQLNQVFMNIISNAIDALENQPEPRQITIRTELLNTRNCEESQEEGLSSTPDTVTSNDVVIRIRDNGSGISQNVIRHLFEPFFTTKPVGKGTGLGLSISNQIVVEKHGGILKCLSEPGEGAEFWIQIPIAPQ